MKVAQMRLTGVQRRFQVFYADPPWKFKTWSKKGTGRGAVSHYKVMKLPAIIKYMQDAVERYAAPDCVMLLWVPDNMIEHGLAVINACGFKVKTLGFNWVKTTKNGKWHFGNGYWTRANPELCWLATRGHPKRKSKSVRKLVIDQVRQHSQKPNIHEKIEDLLDGPYLELFARVTTPGWSAVGNQVGLLDRGPVKTRRQPSNLAA
jgi:N6-adenosine-specific RNA methylase IME4